MSDNVEEKRYRVGHLRNPRPEEDTLAKVLAWLFKSEARGKSDGSK